MGSVPRCERLRRVHEDLQQRASVLVEGNLIRTVSSSPMSSDGAKVIDGDGRTLMPGLSDAHVHLTVNDTFERLGYSLPQVYVGALAAVNSRAMLHRGFTTVRDVGGPAIGLNMAVDEGVVVEGPRILPSGAFISQSAGHGDFDSRIRHLCSSRMPRRS